MGRQDPSKAQHLLERTLILLSPNRREISYDFLPILYTPLAQGSGQKVNSIGLHCNMIYQPIQLAQRRGWPASMVVAASLHTQPPRSDKANTNLCFATVFGQRCLHLAKLGFLYSNLAIELNGQRYCKCKFS